MYRNLVVSVFFTTLLSGALSHDAPHAPKHLAPSSSHAPRLHDRPHAPKHSSSHAARSHDGPHAPKHLAPSSSHALRLHSVRVQESSCEYQCPNPQLAPDYSTNFMLMLKVKPNFYAFKNSTTETSVIFERLQPYLLLVDEKTRVAIFIDISTGTGEYFGSASKESGTWDFDKLNHLEKFQTLKQIIETWKGGQKFQSKSLSETIRDEASTIVKTLSYSAKLRIDSKRHNGVSMITAIRRSLLERKHIGTHVLDNIGAERSFIFGGLIKYTQYIKGLDNLIQKLSISVENLITKDVKVSLLFGSSNGVSFLLNLLSQLNADTDFSKALGSRVNPVDFMSVATKFDEGIYPSRAGIFAVVNAVQLHADKKISLEALIDILIQVESWNMIVVSREFFYSRITRHIQIIRNKIEKSNSTETFSALLKYLQDIKDEKLEHNGINISKIINKLIGHSGKPDMNNLLDIVLELKLLAPVSKLLSTLYIRLIYFIVSGQGIWAIKELIPTLVIEINLDSTTSIIQQLLSSINLGNLTKYIVSLDIVGLIKNLPVLGPVLEAVDSSAKQVGVATQSSLSSTLKESSSILGELKNWIWHGLGLAGGSKPSGGPVNGGGLVVGIIVTTETDTSSSIGSGSTGSESSGSQGTGSTGSQSGQSQGGGSFGSGGSTGSGGGWWGSWGSSISRPIQWTFGSGSGGGHTHGHGKGDGGKHWGNWGSGNSGQRESWTLGTGSGGGHGKGGGGMNWGHGGSGSTGHRGSWSWSSGSSSGHKHGHGGHRWGIRSGSPDKGKNIEKDAPQATK